MTTTSSAQIETPSARPRRSLAPTLVAGGLALFAASGLALTQLGSTQAGAATAYESAAPARPGTITLAPGDVSVVRQVYEPGQKSGWHAHSGIHAVAVLSGTLKVYDGQCQLHTYEAGKPYVGGQELHLVVNDSDTPVEMVVTYLHAAGPQESTKHFPAPAGCTAG